MINKNDIGQFFLDSYCVIILDVQVDCTLLWGPKLPERWWRLFHFGHQPYTRNDLRLKWFSSSISSLIRCILLTLPQYILSEDDSKPVTPVACSWNCPNILSSRHLRGYFSYALSTIYTFPFHEYLWLFEINFETLWHVTEQDHIPSLEHFSVLLNTTKNGQLRLALYRALRVLFSHLQLA